MLVRSRLEDGVGDARGGRPWRSRARFWRSTRAPPRAAPSCSAPDLRVRGSAQREFAQHYPASGWVEHDPEDIWRTTVETARQALAAARLGAGDIAAIGITNQRETCVVWDRRTGKPIHRAIVWQDRRTADALPQPEATPATSRRSPPRPACCSIPISRPPRSPGCSTMWRARARSPRPASSAFGTIDSFLIWRLTGGRVHATDATNASRTLLYDIAKGAFDDDLLRAVRRAARACCPRCATATPTSA